MRARSLFEVLSPDSRVRLVRRRQPHWTAPMLATLTDDYFSDPGWIFERKLDGVRCLVFRTGGRVRLLSRNREDMTSTWPEVADALRRGPRGSFIADGEIVSFSHGRTSFERLQQRIGMTDARRARASNVRVYLYLFDLLHVHGYDVTGLPLRSRKTLLKRAVPFTSPVRFTPHRNGEGEALLTTACRRGWEGLIAKEAASTYVHRRSRSWLKFKCVNSQELVVGGFTDPAGSRIGLGALLVGFYEKGQLLYAGKVGTGYDDDTLRDLRARLDKLEQARSPFADLSRAGHTHWARPVLVAECAFTEWTRHHRLRHPRFLGLRRDKRARAVGRERPR